MVKKPDGRNLKIEVKGVNKKSDDWPLSCGELVDDLDLYFILISYESEINNLNVHPKVWVIPANVINDNCKKSPTKSGKYLKYFSHKLVREEFSKYKDNWEPII